jgi:hypothetical protein
MLKISILINIWNNGKQKGRKSTFMVPVKIEELPTYLSERLQLISK